jgi:hypothetical protein
MGRREAICNRENRQSTNIGGKGKRDSRVDCLSGGEDELRKKRWDYEKENDTWQLGLWLKVAED